MENDWNEHKLLVMQSLTELKQQNDKILGQITDLRTDVTVLKVKAGLWGFFAGTLGTVITYMFRGIGHGN